MRRLHIPRYVGGTSVAPTQAETTSWIAQVVTNGGTVSAARAVIVNQFIYAEKQAGTWALTDDYWPLWGENAVQSLTSLKQLRLATVVAAPSFTVDRGYTFDGVANYINTGFSCATHAVAMTGTNNRCAIYERTNVTGNVNAMGCQDTANTGIGLRPRSGTTMNTNNACANIPYTLVVLDSRGYSACSRNGADQTTCFGYKNGGALVQGASTTFASALTSSALYIGCRSNASVAELFRACSVGLAAVGAQLSAAQEVAQYNNVQAWATAIGANV